MRLGYLLGGAALALTSALAIAQDAPESLLPKMFDEPAPARIPAPARTPTPRPAATNGSTPAAPRSVSTPVVQALPTGMPLPNLTLPVVQQDHGGLARIPSLEELEKMTPEDFEALLGNRILFDMPPQARRSMDEAGLLDENEGGLRADSLADQSGSLIRLALAANRGTLVSRWGHIVLRRALTSRLQSPAGMSPQDFLALRVALLQRMGETDAARALLQQLDIADYTPAVGATVLDVYARTADFTGLCPVMATQAALRDDPEWNVARTMCDAFRGNSATAIAKLDRQLSRIRDPKIDLLLAQKYAGAAGKSRRAVTIEWNDVADLTPWRYGLAIGVGLEPPEKLVTASGPAYAYTTSLAPMVSLARRAMAADRSAAAGVLSNAAMVDLYAELYADPDVTGEWQDRSESLRDAYTQEDPQARFVAMQALWRGAEGQELYSRQVLTAAAAARMMPIPELVDGAPSLIASMLAAGYDANALRWSSVVNSGTPGWGLLVLAAPGRLAALDTGALDKYVGGDDSTGKRRSAFLVAGLAGLDRLNSGDVSRYSADMALRLDTETRFTRAIESAAGRGDAASVVLLAAFGMQGDDWHRMTPRYLYHIVSALRQVGLEAEARMIAAEAVARV